MPEPIIIKNTQAPGDYIVLSAALRDINLCYPNKYEIIVNVPQLDVFRNNPHVRVGGKRRGARTVVAKYNDKRARFGIHKSNQLRAHFMWGFLAGLNLQLGTSAYLTDFRPDLHLTPEEKMTPIISTDKPYWVFVSGGKLDFTAKWWDKVWWQQLVDALKDKVTMVQVGGGSHIHPPIAGVYDLVKKTSFRDLMRLIYHSQGVICIVTCLMHIAAAFNKPCVILGGGREPWWWEAYDKENRLVNMRFGQPTWTPPKNDIFIPHRYIHTMNELGCCTNKGCWRARVGPTGKRCLQQAMQHGVYLPRCLQLIPPERVIENWKWYFDEGICSLKGGKALIVPELPPAVEAPQPFAPPPPEDAPKEPVKVTVPTFLAVLVGEKNPDPLQYVADLKQYVAEAGAEMTVFYNGYDAKLTTFCSQNGVPVHMSPERPGRSELMRRMLFLAHKDVVVWLEDTVAPIRPDWLACLVNAVGDNGHAAAGTLRWRRVNQAQLELVKSAPWYRGLELCMFPFDLAARKVYYLERGLFAVPSAVLRELNWPDKRLPEADLDILFGEALRQHGVELKNIGAVVNYA